MFNIEKKREYCKTFAKHFPRLTGNRAEILTPNSYVTFEGAIYYIDENKEMVLLNLSNDIEVQRMFNKLKGQGE